MDGKYIEDEYLEKDARVVLADEIIDDFNASKQIFVVAEETSTFVKNYDISRNISTNQIIWLGIV